MAPLSRRISVFRVLAWCAGLLIVATVSPSASDSPSAGRSARHAEPPSQEGGGVATVTQQQEMVTKYCVTCHSERVKSGDLVLDPATLSDVPGHAVQWEKVIRKLNAGLMPPPGMPRPDEPVLRGFRTFLEGKLDTAAAANPNPGRPMLHRMNRTEYANAIRDLLKLDVDAATLLPPDDSAYGFDNVSDVLGVSPSLQERYLTAATRISAIAVGDVGLRPTSTTYRVPQDLSQNQHVEGLPLGTIGGLRVRHFFPVDGEYDFQTKLYRTNLNIVRGLEYPSEFEVAIDGKAVHHVTIGGTDDLAALFNKPTDTSDAVDTRMRVKVPVTAGTHDVTVTFIGNLPLKDTQRLQMFLRSSADNFDWSGRPHIQTMTVSGPFTPTGPGRSESRREIFVCGASAPKSATGGVKTISTASARPAAAAGERDCARRILSRIARRAYRRPIGDAELVPVMTFYDEGRAKGSFDAGIQRGLERILASPLFVFRVEQDPAGAIPGRPYRVSDVELASRLSFFLWSSIPDEELLRVAEQGRLRTPAVLTQQVTRMLADPRADALVANFAGQWLQLRNIRSIQPNSDLFPDFDDNLRQAFRRETELLFASIIHEDRSVVNLLNADYTFVNERLARHYAIPNIYGTQFRRVPVPDEARRGLLGQGSMLAVTSHAERTSPVLRGKWVLENLLGLPVPPPPGDVPPLAAQPAEAPKTLRQQMEAHRATPVCASCHKVMDPIGFALENFDAVGAWRTREPGGAIDASGQLADGTKIDGVNELRKAILARPELFVATMTDKMMTYALGRGVETFDRPVVRGIVRDAAKENYRFSALVRGIVQSAPFQMRVRPVNGGAPESRRAGL
jgi:cytochrome c553